MKSFTVILPVEPLPSFHGGGQDGGGDPDDRDPFQDTGPDAVWDPDLDRPVRHPDGSYTREISRLEFGLLGLAAIAAFGIAIGLRL